MAKSLTTRFGLQRWSAEPDTQQRSEFDNDNGQIEALAAMADHGRLGDRPAANAAHADMFWMITDATGGGIIGTLYYCDGAAWTKVATDTFVGCKVRRTTTQLTATNTSTTVTWTAEDFDTNAFHDPTTNPSRLTIPTGFDGYYDVGAVIAWGAFGGGSRLAAILLNGTVVVADERPAVATGQNTYNNPSTLLHLVAGDYLTVSGYQDWGGDLNMDVPYQAPAFWLSRRGS